MLKGVEEDLLYFDLFYVTEYGKKEEWSKSLSRGMGLSIKGEINLLVSKKKWTKGKDILTRIRMERS